MRDGTHTSKMKTAGMHERTPTEISGSLFPEFTGRNWTAIERRILCQGLVIETSSVAIILRPTAPYEFSVSTHGEQGLVVCDRLRHMTRRRLGVKRSRFKSRQPDQNGGSERRRYVRKVKSKK